jgi:transposase-like protein
MAGRKVFNEQDARRCLAAVNRTGRELATWARQHGVDGRSLNLWRVNLERRGGVRERRAPKLVEVVVAQTPVVPASAPLVLRVGGVELEVGSSFDEGALRRLVRVLKTC